MAAPVAAYLRLGLAVVFIASLIFVLARRLRPLLVRVVDTIQELCSRTLIDRISGTKIGAGK
jgi:hypothetical protein